MDTSTCPISPYFYANQAIYATPHINTTQGVSSAEKEETKEKASPFITAG
jgi:hypothetical protein